MRARMRTVRACVLVAIALVVVLLSNRFEAWRPISSEQRAAQTIEVVSGRDSGPGSLREAILRSARSEGRSRIVLRAPRIALRTVLPPLLNGLTLDATQSHCEIDASGMGNQPVLQLVGSGGNILGLRVRNASGTAILIRASGVQLRGVEIRESADGVSVGGTSRSVTIARCVFDRNGTGVRVDPQSAGVAVRYNRFSHHDRAAVWAVAAKRSSQKLVLQDNVFFADRVSAVIINVGANIERNEFREARERALYLTGSGTTVRGNRIVGSTGSGILVDGGVGTLVESNEIDHNAAVAILLRSCAGTIVRRNRLYGNAYGIAIIFGESGTNVVADNLIVTSTSDALFILGASPLIRGNRLLQNAGAAVRVLDYLPWSGPPVVAAPRFETNVLRANGTDVTVHGVYRPPHDAEPGT